MRNPPQPKKIKKILTAHGDERIDNYYWLRDDTRSNDEVLSYLKDENKYLEQWFSENGDLRNDIYNELVSYIPKKEVSIKIKYGDCYYYSEMESENQYRTYFKEFNGNNEVILDLNKMSEGFDYYNISSVTPSPDNLLIAFGEDLSGRREYNLKIKELSTSNIIDALVVNSSGDYAWSKDCKSIYYVKKDPVTLIENTVYRHNLGDDQNNDQLIYEEKDPQFHISLDQSRTKKYLFINTNKTESSETWILDLDINNADPICILERSDNHIYSIEDTPECFYVLTNSNNQKNFALMKFNHEHFNNIDYWKPVIPYNSNIFIDDFVSFPNYIYLEVREDGLPKILKLNRDSLKESYINFDEAAFSCYLSVNNDYQSDNFFYGYSSPRKPSSIYRERIDTGSSEIVWQQEINNYDENLFEVERLKIKSRDSIDVPVSLVYKKGIDLKNAPILIYGYGSYGIIVDATFKTSILPLLNKGFIFAIANIRGGSEMGRQWYEDGKIFNKLNTFYDFIDSTKELIKKGYGSHNKVFAMGGSAGGLLMGAIINMEPELYTGIVSAVPFVDVVTTMSDESIPLTTFEYKEWGNPANIDEYNYIKSYSPYDNIKPSNYPAVLVTSSLYDSQVQYYEPAKYVPKLRENNLSNNPIIMKMNLIGGHGGKSGRLNALEEVALDNAFLLNLAI